ncbi:MAG: hypothetical protein BGO08_04590 [Altererythrobacter sp. 66-12]|nr:MAG: hypothetical protein BGO08_04590 [Altererythrobacter sp. 66-12]
MRRSAYEVEINPWSRRGDVEAALFFRGAIVSAYGYIETILGEICIKASRLPQYAVLRESFPHSADQRVSFLRRAFALDPLREYQPWATLFLDQFETHGELRNLAAHAYMQVLPNWGVTFRDLRRDGPAMINSRSQRMTIPELEVAAWRATRLSRLCQHLVNRLNAAEILAKID